MSIGTFTIRARAARDLQHHADWLRQQADPNVANGLLLAADASFRLLARSPGIGGLAEARALELAGARKWRVDGYANYLIFYASRRRGGITILRVLHAAQDWKQY